MADKSLSFDVVALDKTSKALEAVALRLDKLSARLDRLDAKRVKVDVDVDTKGAEANLARFAKTASKSGADAGIGMTESLRGILTSPAGIGAAAAVGFALLPAAADVASTATVLALGAGLSGIGAVVVAKTAEGERALARFKDDASLILRQTAVPFEATFESILNSGKTSLAGLSGYMQHFFTLTGPATRRFFANFGRGIDELGPTFDELGKAFNAALDAIGPELPAMFAAIGRAATNMEAAVAANPQVFVDITAYMGQTTMGALDLVAALTRVAGWFDQGPIDRAFFSALTGNIFTITAGITDLTTGQDKAGVSAAALSGKQKALSVSEEKAAAAAAAHAKALQDEIDKLTKASQVADDAARSQIQFKQTVADAMATIKKNGKTLDTSTAKGRANALALLDIGDAYRQEATAAVQAGKGTQKVAQIQAQGAVAYEKAARAAGQTTKAIDAYIKRTFGVPGVKVTRLEADKSNAERNLAKVKRELNDPNLTKTRRAKLEAEKKQLDRAVTAAKAKLFQLTHTRWTVTIHGQYYFTRPPGFIGPVVPHRAAGGPVSAGRTYLVGEQGPELLTMPRNGNVTPAPETAQILAGGGQDVTVTVLLDGQAIEPRMYKVIRADKQSTKQRTMARAGAVK